jgi:hypothetical protein
MNPKRSEQLYVGKIINGKIYAREIEKKEMWALTTYRLFPCIEISEGTIFHFRTVYRSTIPTHDFFAESTLTMNGNPQKTKNMVRWVPYAIPEIYFTKIR